MLTPEQIEKIQIEASRITLNMQKNIMDRIVKGIRKAGEITSSTDYLIYRAKELGASKEYIQNEIQKQLNLTDKELQEMFEQAGRNSYAYDKDIYKLAKKPYTKFEDNEAIQNIISNVIERTQGEMRNITRSLGFAELINGKIAYTDIGTFYQNTMDTAFYGVYNGTDTIERAVKDATRTMANSGIRSVDYITGHHNRVDVAVRRNIMTSLTQMQEQITEHNAEELGTTIFEFSWHTGARPSHGWGGQRYDTTGKDYPTQEQVYAMYGGGTMDDYNCRHSVYPTFKEFAPMYSKEQLERLNRQEQVKKEWQGKEYNKYEQTQKAREMETKMRKIRSNIDLLKKNEDIEQDLIRSQRTKYRAMMDEYTRFCRAMGIPAQKERVYQDALGRV
jgi:hypothetical protein